MSHGRSSSISRFHQPTNSLLHNRSPSSNNIASFPSNSDSMISPKYFRTPSSSALVDILKYRLRKLKPLDVIYSLTFSYAFLVFLSGVLGRGYEPPLDLNSLSSHNFDPRVQWVEGKVQPNYPSYSDPDTPDDSKHIKLPPVKYFREEEEGEEELQQVKPKARLDGNDEKRRANPPPAKQHQAPGEIPEQKLRPLGKLRDGDDGFGKKRQKLAEEEKKHLLREEEEKRLRKYHDDEEHEEEVRFQEKKVGEKQAFAKQRPADRVEVDHDANVDPEERELFEAKAKAQAIRFEQVGPGGVRRLPKNSDPEEPTHVTSEEDEEEEGSHMMDIHQPESKDRDSSHDSSPDFVRDSPKDKHLDPQHDAHDHHEDDNLFTSTEEDAEEEEEKENIKPAVLGGVGGRGAPPLVGVRGKQRLGELLGEERGKGAAAVDEAGDDEVALGDDDEMKKRA